MRNSFHKLFAVLLLITCFNSSNSFADGAGDHEKEKDKKPLPKPLCFTLFCIYHRKADDHRGPMKCRAASDFKKNVAPNGDELWDNSMPGTHPSLEVECDHTLVYRSGGIRYTDWNGTRVQGTPGPFPAITLPREALHEGHYYSYSFLQFEDQTLPGQCFIYTKAPVE